jgi:DNA-binding NtrC family response regulator
MTANEEQGRTAPGADSLSVSPKMRQLFQYAARIAAGDAKVLITGEPGVGKHIVARHIHARSTRRRREYVAVKCGGAAEASIERDLFGSGDNGVTGRIQPGKLQLAHRSTLFLDGLGEMSPRTQERLLRFLENGELPSPGAGRSPTVLNVRVVASTPCNLPELVAAGKFREDLLHRLRAVHLHVPPLRERAEDTRVLGEAYLEQSGRKVRLTDSAWAVLADYRWPGNVRELQHVMEQLAWLANGTDRCLDVADLPSGVRGQEEQAGTVVERRRQTADVLYANLVGGGHTFWTDVQPMFLNRDITRHDMRELIRRGLAVSLGSYHRLLDLFSIPEGDHARFMEMLSTYDCRPEPQEPSADRAADRTADRTPATNSMDPPREMDPAAETGYP